MCATGALAGVLTLGALLPASANATPEEVRAELQEAEAPAGSLALDDRVPLAGGAAVYRFAQERAGIPVDRSEAIVLDTVGGGAELLADQTTARMGDPGEPAVGAREAVRAAREAVAATALAARPEAEPAIDPAGDGVLVWRVSLSSERPLGDFEVLVDAATGEVRAQRDLTWRATGSAEIFLPNAVVENAGYGVYGDPAGTFPIRDRNDRDSPELTSLRSAVTLERMNQKRPCLKGAYAEARVGSRAKRVCRDSRNWSAVTREAGRFEALMAYHHVDQAQEYLAEVLDAPEVDDDRQIVVANAFSADNSFYMPGADAIRLGTGGVDDGEDGDVIVHEFGHAVQDTQVPGFGTSNHAGAIGEAWGDYLAAAVSEELWGTSGEFSSCIMEWDAVSYDTDDPPDSPGICLRRTDVDRTLEAQRDFCEDETGQANEIHCVGEAWSSALWGLRQELGDDGTGRATMDRVIVESHPMLARGTSFGAAAEALIAADELLYSGPNDDHCTEIRAEMVARGFLGSGFDCPPA